MFFFPTTLHSKAERNVEFLLPALRVGRFPGWLLRLQLRGDYRM